MKGKVLRVDKSEVPSKRRKFDKVYEFESKMEKDIKVNKKRKKKRMIDSNQVPADSEKKFKTEEINNTTEQNNTENFNNSDDSDHEEMQKVKISTEESNQITGKFLRNSFNSANGLGILQKFILICNQNDKKDLAAEYLEAGGSVLEVLRLLDTSEKKNFNNASIVFSAMHIIIIKILAQYPQNQSSAEEACRHLINTHLASVHSMLSSQSKVKHRKIVLRLLAAIVSLGGTLPRELLNHLTLHSQLVEVLVSHTKPTDTQCVRTCFIHFILAFLIEGSASDIRALLEKRGVLSSIFSGLIYDYSSVVQLVLTTVKKYVLENPIITKTTKLHIFSTPVIQGIVNLYNWKGPKNWPGHKKQKSLTEQIDPKEKEITVNAVHEFLVTLLTSNRYGIAFHDRSLGTDSGRKHNQIIDTILQSLDKPWEHDKPSELVVKILSACPDLIKLQLVYTEPFLVPRISNKWIAVIQFVRKIINGIDVESCMKLRSTDMTIVQLANAIINLTLPPIVIKNAVIPSLEHSSHVVHYEVINLQLTMIRKVESFIEAFENIKYNQSEKFILKNLILEHIIKHMPSFESILNIWIKAFSQDSEIQSSDVEEKDLHIEIKDHLLAMLNLLQAYSEICPEILLATSSTNMQNKSTLLLTNLCDMQNISEEELTIMKVKALKILLSSNVAGFSPNEDIFSVALSFLITKIGDKNVSLDTEVRETINLLLNGCGIFEGYNDQIEIWIDSIIYLESFDDKLEVANWIAKIIKRISKNTDKYISLIHKIEENTGEEVINVNRQEDIFNELSERNFEDIKSIDRMLPVTSISLLSYSTIENLKKSSSDILAHYMAIVLTHTLHCQISLRAFTYLVEGLKIPAQSYLISWSNHDSSVVIKKPFNSKSIFRIISRILLNPSKVCNINVKEVQLSIELDGCSMDYTLTNFDVKALFRMVIFYLTQLLRQTNAELENIEVYTTILLSLLKIAKEMENNSKDLIEDCAKWIFKHPVILQYFKGIYKKKNSAESMITTLLIEICTLFFEFNKQSLVLQYIHPYQEKFIMQIKSTVSKHKDAYPKKELKAHVELIHYLQLNIKVTVDLLCTIMSLPKERFVISENSALSIWGVMVPRLIERFFSKEIRNDLNSFITIQESLLKKLFYYLVELKISCNQQMHLWENSLYDYLLKFPHSISGIDNKIFTSLMKSNVNLTTKRILNLLVERNPKFITAFLKYSNNNEAIFQQESLIFSIVSSNLSFKWDQEFLKKLYRFYKNDLIAFLTDPKTDEFSWIRENVDAAAYLIESSFEPKLCKETCDIILSNGNKLDAVQEEHIKLFCKLFKKSIEIKSTALKDFVQVLVHITVTALKKESKNVTKLNFLCKVLIDTINTLKLENNFTFEEISKNYSWPQFTRIILKSGLKITKEDKKEAPFLIKALTTTCDVAYKDNGSEEYIKTIFEMTTSHSEFINVMLSSENVKRDLTELLWTLVRKNHTVMLATHIPLYLASYNATLSMSDQFILKILQHYESNGIKLDDYRPYLWGSAAASHYSVKGDTSTALWRQPSTSQVLDLFVPEVVTTTIKNYPVQRNWKCDFTNAVNTVDEIYDPAFYLPVLTHLLADNNVVACHKVTHSGALALTIIACSSTCEQIRLTAYTVISRFYFHLEATSSREKLLWIHFIDALRNGIVRTESPLENIRLNGFVATFLARTCLVMSQPLNPLYSSLQAFLMAKPALDLNTIPELLQLYHSSEIEHQQHRHWILRVICDGLKIDNDMDVALKCVLFKMLFDFYISTLSDKLTKNLILQIVRSATKLTKSCMILLNGYALLPWLITVTERLNKGDVDSIVCLIDIVNNIVNILHATKSKEIYHHLLLIRVLLGLKVYFNHSLTTECFKAYIDILNKVIINNSVGKAFTKDHLKDVVNFSKQVLEDVSECEAMLQFGCKFVKRKNLELDSHATPQDSLCRLIMTWYNHFKSNK